MNIKSNEIKLVNINDIQPNNKNRNYHSEEQIDRLVEIIKYQGFRSPLIISNRSGILVSGHGRLLAARKLGLAKLPVIYQDFDSEEQEYAAGISDNSITSWSQLDLSGINFDITDLGPDFDLDLLGIRNFHVDVNDKVINEVNKSDETAAWVGMPEFEIADEDIKLTMVFLTELERDLFVEKNNITITNKRKNVWTSRL